MAKTAARVQKKLHERHRAHKRDSLPAKPVGEGRDARKAAKRAARAAYIGALVADAEAAIDALHDEANEIDDQWTAEVIAADFAMDEAHDEALVEDAAR